MKSNVGRVLRLTLLAPDIVEAILIGRQPAEVTLARLMRPFAVDRASQNFIGKIIGLHSEFDRRCLLIGCLPRSLSRLDVVARMAEFCRVMFHQE